MTAPGLLVWDFDGTLAQRDGLWSQTIADVVNAHVTDRPPVTPADIAPHLARGFPWHTPQAPHPEPRDAETWWSRLHPVLLGALVHGGDLPVDLAMALVPSVRTAYLDPAGWSVYPDVRPSLRALGAAGWTHRILSNHVPELPDLVHALDLADRFERIVTSGATGYEKPHPRAFEIATAPPSPRGAVWMVGDSVDADVHGAEAAGIPAVLVRRTHASVRRQFDDLHGFTAWLTRSS